jgi:hypothetical protein
MVALCGYPVRTSLETYTVDMAADRLPELLSYKQPVAITNNTGGHPWVLVPASLYDTMLVCWSHVNYTMEQRRQQAEPLPTLTPST